MNQLGSTSDYLGNDHPTIRRRQLLFRDIALCGARRPDQLDPIGDIDGWHIYEASITEIDAILKRCNKGSRVAEFTATPPLKRPVVRQLSPVPLVTAAVAWWHWGALERGREVLPFVLTIALFLLSFLGLGISLWPNIIPPDISIWEAAAPPETQAFVLIGTAILLPIVLGYTAVTYYVFRGKVRAGEGYH